MRRTLLALVLLAVGGSMARARCPEEPPQQIEARIEPALAESLTTVYFASGSARVGDAARDEIRQAAEWLADHPEADAGKTATRMMNVGWLGADQLLRGVTWHPPAAV